MWKSVLYIVLAYVIVVSEAEQSIVCNYDGPVSFKCPCCPEELEQCIFRKLFQPGNIAADGSIQKENYEFNDEKTHVTLKKCSGDDDGTYVWRCDKCNVTEMFHLKVENVKETSSEVSTLPSFVPETSSEVLTLTSFAPEASLACSSGSEVSFQCPCCAEDPECRFKKLDGANVVLDGVLTDPDRMYEYDDKSRIVLKECKEEDEGTYEWYCQRCKTVSRFHLEFLTLTSFAPEKELQKITNLVNAINEMSQNGSTFLASRHSTFSVLMINIIILLFSVS